MAVVDWLMHSQPTPELALEPHSKAGHDFYHDAMARLICPVDYNWSNMQYVSLTAISHFMTDTISTGIEKTYAISIQTISSLLTAGLISFTRMSGMILKIQSRVL